MFKWITGGAVAVCLSYLANNPEAVGVWLAHVDMALTLTLLK